MSGLVKLEAAQLGSITIVGGTGDQGYGLALRWALAGKDIVIGSRDATKAEEAAARLSAAIAATGKEAPQIRGLANPAAVAESSVVVITVPLAAQAATIKAIREALLPGTLLIDVTVPLATAIGGRASRMLGLPAGSAAQQLAEYAPTTVQVASAFHFLSAELLADPALELDCDVVGCGGNADAQETLRDLAESIAGVRYVHAGPLATSALVEAAATMLIAINIRHKTRSAGMRVTGVSPARAESA